MKLSPRLVFMAMTVAALASCASPPPEPLPVAVVPPAAPRPPPVALSSSVLQAAGAYRLYMRRAADISPAFADGQAVEDALVSAVSYEPRQFMRGVIAYAALVALQSPQFVAGVRTYAVDPAGRRALAAKLFADPNYAQALPSAANAAGLVSSALIADAAKVRRAGEQVKQAAYDVQRQNWSKLEIAGRDARLANAKTLSAQPISAPAEDVRLLSTAVGGSDSTGVSLLGVSGQALAPPYTAAINHGLAIAALAALGEAGEANDSALQGLLEERSSDFCMNMAKLNVYQCLSVAKPYYEDVFCLGQHILLDTAQCVSKAAGEPQPAVIPVSAPVSKTGYTPTNAKPVKSTSKRSSSKRSSSTASR